MVDMQGSETRVFERILCGVDGAPASLAAVRAASRLQLREGCLRFVAATSIAKAAHAGMAATHAAGLLQDEAEAALAEALAVVPSAAGKLVVGNPATALLREAEADETTLVVVGSHGHRRATAMLLGTVALTLLRDAPCSVLIARDVTEPETWPRAVASASTALPSPLLRSRSHGRSPAASRPTFKSSLRRRTTSTPSWRQHSHRSSRSTPKAPSLRSWPRRNRLTSSSSGVAVCTV